MAAASCVTKVLASANQGLPRPVVVVFGNPTSPRDVDSGRTLPGPRTYETVGTLTCWQDRDGEWWGAADLQPPHPELPATSMAATLWQS